MLSTGDIVLLFTKIAMLSSDLKIVMLSTVDMVVLFTKIVMLSSEDSNAIYWIYCSVAIF